jgi:CRP/FNR family transcriptional regulator
MIDSTTILNQFKIAHSYLSADFLNKLIAEAQIVTIPKDTEILHEGQYVKLVPVVLDGLIKVFKRHEEKELLLYYIQSNESCIMSFSAGLENQTSKIFALTEEDTTAILLPANKLSAWIKQYPELNILFYRQFHARYSDLLETIGHVLFDKMDKRLYLYLKEKAELTHSNPLKISHRQIALELGTAREVVSRVLKKLEEDNKIKQDGQGIEIL